MRISNFFLIACLFIFACNGNNEKQMGFCDCVELEMEIGAIAEGGDRKKLPELEKQRNESCEVLRGLSIDEFYEKVNDCK